MSITIDEVQDLAAAARESVPAFEIDPRARNAVSGLLASASALVLDPGSDEHMSNELALEQIALALRYLCAPFGRRSGGGL